MKNKIKDMQKSFIIFLHVFFYFSDSATVQSVYVRHCFKYDKPVYEYLCMYRNVIK